MLDCQDMTYRDALRVADPYGRHAFDERMGEACA